MSGTVKAYRGAENAGRENDGPKLMTGHENAGHEIAGQEQDMKLTQKRQT